MTPAVRIANLADAAALSHLHAASFGEGWSQSAFEGLLKDPHITGWLVEAQAGTGEPESGPGLAGLEALVLIRAVLDEAEILTLAVAPHVRRQGHARLVVETAVVAVAALGAAGLFLEVAATNEAARALYRSLGFEEVARRKAYYREAGGDMEDALVLKLSLPGVSPAR